MENNIKLKNDIDLKELEKFNGHLTEYIERQKIIRPLLAFLER